MSSSRARRSPSSWSTCVVARRSRRVVRALSTVVRARLVLAAAVVAAATFVVWPSRQATTPPSESIVRDAAARRRAFAGARRLAPGTRRRLTGECGGRARPWPSTVRTAVNGPRQSRVRNERRMASTLAPIDHEPATFLKCSRRRDGGRPSGGRPPRRLHALTRRGTRCSRRPTSRASHYESLARGARHAVARRLRGALRRPRPRLPRPGHHVLALRRGAAVPARPRAPHHRRRRVGGHRGGRAPAGARARARSWPTSTGRARSSPTASCPAGWWRARRTSTAACTGIDPDRRRAGPRRRASTSCATAPAASGCSRTTSARRRASRT